jgi:hypothetical protein
VESEEEYGKFPPYKKENGKQFSSKGLSSLNFPVSEFCI